MKADIAIRATKLFPEMFPDAWKHRECPDPTKGSMDTICPKCKKKMSVFDGNREKVTEAFYKSCTVPDPIVIDWNVAMKLRDEMRNSRIWNDACYEVWKNYTEKAVTQEVFWRDYAIPKHYIEAACVAKEAENE